MIFFSSENCLLIHLNRMPLDVEKREEWIENIQNHQQFTLIDQKTMRFSVCNQHFEPNKMRKRTQGRLIAVGPPTIFPKITNVACPSHQNTTSAATILQEKVEFTKMTPLIEPQSCLEQYKR